MWKNEKAVLNKKPNFEKLIKYGFKIKKGIYLFSTDIVDSSFLLNIYVSADNETNLEVIDKETGDEYTLVGNPNYVGAFVGRVRTECEEVLTHIVLNCYESDLFKSNQAKQIANYIAEKYGIYPEYLWGKTPNNSIFRENESGKWFCVFLMLPWRKLGVDKEGDVEIINLKASPKNVKKLLETKDYFPAFHMNKKHWYSLPLDGSLKTEEIYSNIDMSFKSVKQFHKS